MTAKPPPLPVARFTREEFIATRWDYTAGEHVSFLGPTGSGKTTLAFQILKATARPDLPAIVLVTKPRDATVTKFYKDAAYRHVKNWPPPTSIWQPGKPAGYALWPKTSFDPYQDDAHHAEVFERALLDSYKKGDRILFADETYSLDRELGLGKPLITLWTKGRSMGTGLWAATQKPTHVPTWMYGQATHLFLAFDPDRRARDRYREISGVDPDVVGHTLQGLDKHEWLYINVAGRGSTMGVVKA